MYDNFNNLKDFLNNNKVFNLEKNKIIDYEVDSDKYVYTKLWENKSQNLRIGKFNGALWDFSVILNVVYSLVKESMS